MQIFVPRSGEKLCRRSQIDVITVTRLLSAEVNADRNSYLTKPE
jgi:hypothetical protein